MDHKELLKSLTPEQRGVLTRKNNRSGIVALGIHGGIIACLAMLIVARIPGWPLLMLPLGVFLVFLFTLLHETTHRTPFVSRQLNDVVAIVCGVILVLPPEWFRYFHLAHHRYTQDPENDPELATPKPSTKWQYLKHVSGLPVAAGQLKTLMVNATGNCRDRFIPANATQRIRREAQSMLLFYGACLIISFLTQNSTLLFVWVLPMLIGQPALRLYLLAEHAECPLVSNMLKNSRTVYTHRWLYRLAWNMPYHAEHHTFPSVPFHQLPALHRLASKHLGCTEAGYLRFNRGYFSKLDP